MSETGQTAAQRPPKLPSIRPVAAEDIKLALRAGMADFKAAPMFGLFFGGIFVAGGLFILAALMVFEQTWMIIPIGIGFPLVGPFIAVGLYEVSRRRAAGEPLNWKDILLVVFRQRERQLGWMAFVVLFIFWVWMYQIRLLLAIFLGFKSFSSFDAFVDVVTTTPEGVGFLAVGTLVGALLSLVLFSSTVIAMPLLLDRNVDMVSAMIVSFKAVFSNPVVMLGWGIIVAALVIFAMIPVFLGLLIVLPVLGHATWHLYANTVEE